MTKHIILILLTGVGLGACTSDPEGRSTAAQKTQEAMLAEYNAWYEERMKREEEHMRRLEEQQTQLEAQDKRYDALLSKWEEQARRFDAILDRWETLPPRGHNGS